MREERKRGKGRERKDNLDGVANKGGPHVITPITDVAKPKKRKVYSRGCPIWRLTVLV